MIGTHGLQLGVAGVTEPVVQQGWQGGQGGGGSISSTSCPVTRFTEMRSVDTSIFLPLRTYTNFASPSRTTVAPSGPVRVTFWADPWRKTGQPAASVPL